MTDAMVEEFFRSDDPERTLCGHMAALVAGRRAAFRRDGDGTGWSPGEKLRLRLVAYAGAGNIGADLRVSEMIRQFRTIFGADALDLRMLVSDAAVSPDLFPEVGIDLIDGYFPTLLAGMEPECHGIVACEGSMFKSTFSTALTAMLAGGIGLAARLASGDG